MKKKLLYIELCDEAYPNDSDGKRRKGREPNPVACAECESPCVYGIELLKTIEEKAFRELLCGADCKECRQPCNIRRIALMRNIVWANSQREKVRKAWLNIAMKPYYDRRRKGGKA